MRTTLFEWRYLFKTQPVCLSVRLDRTPVPNRYMCSYHLPAKPLSGVCVYIHSFYVFLACQMWMSAVSGSGAPSSAWTQLAAIDVHAERASPLLETAVPVKAFLLHLLLLPLLPPHHKAARQQWVWVITLMQVNEQDRSVSNFVLRSSKVSGQKRGTWPASRSIITFGTRYATLNSYRE